MPSSLSASSSRSHGSGGMSLMVLCTHLICLLLGYAASRFSRAQSLRELHDEMCPPPPPPPPPIVCEVCTDACKDLRGLDVGPGELAECTRAIHAGEWPPLVPGEGPRPILVSSLIPSVSEIRGFAERVQSSCTDIQLPETLPLVVSSLYRSESGVVSPYCAFDLAGWPQDLQGWNGEESALPSLVKEVGASVVVEVGSWKGMSSVALGMALQEVAASKGEGAPPPLLLCVDTWQGAPEFLENRLHGVDPDRDMFTLHGWPHVYYQWLANMKHSGLGKVAFPLPASSLIAAEYIRRADPDFRADVIYIDGRCVEED